jgi:hypothetical protein
MWRPEVCMWSGGYMCMMKNTVRFQVCPGMLTKHQTVFHRGRGAHVPINSVMDQKFVFSGSGLNLNFGSGLFIKIHLNCSSSKHRKKR